MRPRSSLAVLIACGLCACAGNKVPGDDAPTLKALAARQVPVEKDRGIAGSGDVGGADRPDARTVPGVVAFGFPARRQFRNETRYDTSSVGGRIGLR